MLRAGEVFAGYVIERQLGRGGMGSVYLARHPRLPRRIALKLLSTELHTNDEMRARFEREAELVARLDHPNIVAVYDRGVDDGIRWISMQYVDGIDAGALDPRSVDPQRAVDIIAETAKALDYAHAVGVLHRDVKPANILLAHPTAGQDERVLLTDFGIARLRDDAHQLTRTGMFAATLAYASPEQLSATPVDHRSDQYALACTLFWLLSGTAPFTADNPAAIIAGHLHQPPPPIHTRNPNLPPAMDAVLTKALAKHPADRFDSCSELATAARRALTGAIGGATGAKFDQERRAPSDHPSTGHAPPTVPRPWIPPGGQTKSSDDPHELASSEHARQVEPSDFGPGAAPGEQTRRVEPSDFGTGEPTRREQSSGLAAGERTRQEERTESGRRSAFSERISPAADRHELPAGASEGASGTEVERRPGRTARNAGFAGAAVVVVAAVAAGILWANAGSSNTPAASGPGASRTIDWAGAVGPGTADAPRGVEPLTQIDALGKEVGKPGAASTPAGDGKARCAPVTIATTAVFTGPNAGAGRSADGGVKLAIDQFTKANPGCPVALREFDIAGGAQAAAGVAAQIVNDPSIVALIGPVFSTETQAAGQIFDKAGLPFLTPSATDPALSTNGWRTFFRGLAADDAQGTALAKYLVNTARFRKICVIQDKTGYGSSLAGSAVSSLGSAASPNCAAHIAQGDRDFATLTADIVAAEPDAIFYSGFPEAAAALLQQLRRAGVTAPFVSAESTVTPDFVAQAGDSAAGAILSCSCGPVVAQFASDYETLNGHAPGPSSAEAYDLTTIVLKGIAAGRTNRADLVDYLRSYDGPGLARTYRWSTTGELAAPQTWLYKVN
ncbi:bifunctional serine/threonine-protein kinase/ABC transporter substrate-binding protein [Nocardia suismassiliense]|uniref:bifunctional serine/threonine-protein kinase/ABC transporter substrate-binding protein n=1 Tax=Nocardia suismassiliense TaxID=2077092 RepID=UPI001F1DC436|nr:bifunctional serine/threonine-protein kinase/ABC transporter substrate-binding protein [Nocardia suismassiliense]